MPIPRIWTAVAAVLCLLPHLGQSLMCYTCMNLDCPATPKLCADIRAFMVTELKSFYNITDRRSTILEPCPEADDLTSWKLKQVESFRDNAVCLPDRRTGPAPACALSRFRILLQVSYDETIVSHATMMGCARSELMTNLARYQRTYGNTKCASFTTNATTSTLLNLSYEMENCPYPDLCIEDFCISPRNSEVKPFIQQKKDNRFDYGLTLFVIAIVAILIMALVLSMWCQSPLNRPSNMSRV